MNTKPPQQLTRVKTLDFSKWTASFWLIKRKMPQKKAAYDVLRVDIDPGLQERFKEYLRAQLQERDFYSTAYDFNNADGDDTLFTLAATESADFIAVAEAIQQGFDKPHATTYDELLNSWAYIVLFEQGDERLFAWRKINAMTQPKRAKTQKALFFRNHKLVDVDDREVFLIDPRFDFFVYAGLIMIANKREFESSMNFREGIKTSAAAVIHEFETLGFAQNLHHIEAFVGDNLHHLRKLASIQKSGYYKQENYLQSMMHVSAAEGWDLKIDNGKVIIEEETVELLLILLNNDRLRSPINQELFDSAVKAAVSTTAAHKN